MEKTTNAGLSKESKPVNKRITIPASFDMFSMTNINDLPQDKREELIYKIENAKIDLQQEAQQLLLKSRAARFDIENIVEGADVENQKRFTTLQQEGKTATGEYKITVRGGNASIVAPIILAVGVVLILALIVLKSC